MVIRFVYINFYNIILKLNSYKIGGFQFPVAKYMVGFFTGLKAFNKSLHLQQKPTGLKAYLHYYYVFLEQLLIYHLIITCFRALLFLNNIWTDSEWLNEKVVDSKCQIRRWDSCFWDALVFIGSVNRIVVETMHLVLLKANYLYISLYLSVQLLGSMLLCICCYYPSLPYLNVFWSRWFLLFHSTKCI